MNKEQFWRIVEDVRSSTDPRDQGAVLFTLHEQMRKLPSAEIMEWQEIFQFYDDAAYRDELWAQAAPWAPTAQMTDLWTSAVG